MLNTPILKSRPLLLVSILFLQSCIGKNTQFPIKKDASYIKATNADRSNPIDAFAESVENASCKTFDAECIAKTEKIQDPQETRPEILAILEGKQFIERVSDNLDNPYFELKHFHPFINGEKKMIHPSDKDLDEIEKYSKFGYQSVIPKPGMEKKLPPYVIFHTPTDVEGLKDQGYREIWVDSRNSNCDSKAYWNTTPIQELEDWLKKVQNPATPSCSLQNAIHHACWSNPEPRVIVQVREGNYPIRTTYLCSGIIVKNYNNETVTVSSFKDVKAQTNKTWVRVDETQNIWALDWGNQTSERFYGLRVNHKIIRATHHYDNSTIAPDRVGIEEPPMESTPDASYRYVDISVDSSASKVMQEIIEKYREAGETPNTTEVCNISPDLPSSPTWNNTDNKNDMLMVVKTQFHCLTTENCNYKSTDPHYIKKYTDTRNCCSWDSPFAADGSCEMNYRFMTPYQVSRSHFHPKFCSKLTGNPQKCIVLKLPLGDSPENSLVEFNYGEVMFMSPDKKSRNIIFKGLKLDAQVRVYSFLAYPGHDDGDDSENILIDGIEQYGTGIIAFHGGYDTNGGNGILKNSFIHDSGYAVWFINLNLPSSMTNNYLLNTGDKTINVENYPLRFKTLQEFNQGKSSTNKMSRIAWNKIEKGGGLQGYIARDLHVDHNYWIESGGQEVIELSKSIQNISITDNIIENSGHYPFYISGRSFIDGLTYSRNTVINSPTKESGINFSFLIDENTMLANIGSDCRDITISDNLFLEISPKLRVMRVPTFCKNTQIERNLISHSEKPSQETRSVELGAYTKGMENFLFKDNVVLGNIIILYNSRNWNPTAELGNFSPGESLEKCQTYANWMKKYCRTKEGQTESFYGNESSCIEHFSQIEKSSCVRSLGTDAFISFFAPGSRNFIFQDNSAGQVILMYQEKDRLKNNYPSDPSLLDVKASPTQDEKVFMYNQDVNLPDFWN